MLSGKWQESCPLICFFWPPSTGLSIGILGILIIWLLLLFLLYKRKHATSGRHFQSRNSYSDSSLNPRLESDGAYFGVPLFSYRELKEATNNFDHTKEVGDGGFGTVYYGRLLKHYPLNWYTEFVFPLVVYLMLRPLKPRETP